MADSETSGNRNGGTGENGERASRNGVRKRVERKRLVNVEHRNGPNGKRKRAKTASDEQLNGKRKRQRRVTGLHTMSDPKQKRLTGWPLTARSENGNDDRSAPDGTRTTTMTGRPLTAHEND